MQNEKGQKKEIFKESETFCWKKKQENKRNKVRKIKKKN